MKKSILYAVLLTLITSLIFIFNKTEIDAAGNIYWAYIDTDNDGVLDKLKLSSSTVAVQSGETIISSGITTDVKYEWRNINDFKTLRNKIRTIVVGSPTDIIAPSKMDHWFDNMRCASSIDLSGLSGTNLTSMYDTFFYCESLTSIDLGSLVAPNISNMANTFWHCSSLHTIILNGNNLHNSTNISGLFYWCTALSNLTILNPTSVKISSISSAFFKCSSLTSLDLTGWDFSGVTNMYGVFAHCSSLSSLTINNPISLKPTELRETFTYCSSLTSLDLTGWDFSAVTTMESAFAYCTALKSVTFSNANTSVCTSMQRMFMYSGIENCDLSVFNYSSVTTAEGMFFGCSNLSQLDISPFASATNLTNICQLCRDCTALSSFTTGNLSNLNINNIAYMFQDCTSLESIDISKINLVKNDKGNYMLYGAFYGCTHIREITLPSVMVANINDGNADEFVVLPSKTNITDLAENGFFDDDGNCYSTLTSLKASGKTHFVAKLAVTCITNGGTLSSDTPGSVLYKKKLSSFSNPTRDYYTFDGWYTNQNLSNAYNFNNTVVRGPVLYAKWSPINYLVSYVTNGGTNSADNITTYNVETSTFSLKDPTRPGYDFLGWYSESELTNRIYIIKKGSNGNKTFYAKWKPTTYAITYNAYNGSHDNPSTYTIESNTITLQPASKTGYTFDGWYKEATFATKVTSIPQGSYGVVTLYAKFTPISYTIAYNTYNGTNPTSNPASYTIESNTITLQPASKTGYTFDGWYKEETFATKVTSIPQGSYGAVILYAKFTPTTYSLTYEVNGGTNHEDNRATYNIETATFYLKNPTRTGYNFKGWYTEATLINKVTSVEKGTYGNRTFYAKWEAISYDITYKLYSGTNPTSNPSTYTIESNTITLQNASKVGYTFDGWYTETSYNTKVTSIPQGSYGEVTLHAKYTPITYAISYTLNGGSNSEDNRATYNIETATFYLKSPTRTGYNFKGWYTEAAFINKVTSVDKGTYGNQAFYAKWEPISYDITYKLNGGTNPAANPASYTIENNTIILQNVSKVGYTFDGWYKEATFETKVTSIPQGSYGTVTLYAKFTPINYSISYTVNGGKNPEDNRTSYNIETSTFSLKNPTRTGYNFKGWYKEASFINKVTSVDKGSYGNLTFYAKWEAISYNIIYDCAEGTNNTANPSTYTIENAIAFKNPTRSGYQFDGWYKENTYANKASGIDKGTTGNQKFYAKWSTIEYTITYELNGGVNNAENRKTYHTETTTFVLKAPTKAGYAFDGWYRDSSYKDRVLFINKGTVGNQKLYAKWVATPYRITYALDGGTNNGANTDTYTIESKTLVLATPTKPGYDFAGWYADEALTAPITSIEQGSTGDKTVYAKWTISNNTPYTVTIYLQNSDGTTYRQDRIQRFTGTTFSKVEIIPTDIAHYIKPEKTDITINADGNANVDLYYNCQSYTVTFVTDEVFEIQTVLYENNAVMPKEPEKEGYAFINWYSDKILEQVYDFTKPISSDITLYADFKPAYQIVEGADAQFTIAEIESHRIICNGPKNQFIEIMINGELLRQGVDYTLGDDHTEINFTSEYMNALKAGTYNVEMYFNEDYISKTVFIINEKETFPVTAVAAVTTTAVAAAAVYIALKKKKTL